MLIKKFKTNLQTQFSESRSNTILELCLDEDKLESTSVIDFMELMTAE